jgi:exodeoxyribonuclease VII small subunit
MAKSKSTDHDESSLSFEAAMASLEQVVRKLESGSLPLEQMLSEYAKAVEYVQVCHRQLEGARRRIAQLQSVDADGTAVTKAWDDTEPSVQENRDAPSRRKSSS